VERITGETLTGVQGDVRDRTALEAALRNSGAPSAIHFACPKAAGESGEKPLAYYDKTWWERCACWRP
jgi:UDP-glucose 4-epimerase